MTQAIRYVSLPHTSTATRPLAADEFERVTKDGMRQFRRSLAPLTQKQARLLDDLTRTRGLAMVRQALEIARYQSSNPSDAVALTEGWRGFVLAGHAVECPVMDTFRSETEANGTANLAQFEYEIAPTEANRQRAIEALNRQLVDTRRALDALHASGRR